MEEESGFENDSTRGRRVQIRAYQLWEERGHPLDSPETDWFRAEAELAGENHETAHEPPTIAAAKAVGSMLGSVAGLVGSLTNAFTTE